MEVSSRALQAALSPALSGDVEQSALYLRRRLLNIAALGFADFTALALSSTLSAYMAGWVTNVSVSPTWFVLLLPGWYGGAILLNLLPSWGIGPVEELRRLTILVSLTYLITLAASAFASPFGTGEYALAGYVSIAVSYFVSAAMIPLSRIGAKKLLIHREQWGVPAVIYGNGDSVGPIVRILGAERGLGYTPIGIYDDTRERGATCAGLKVLGSTSSTDPALAPVAVLVMTNLGRARSIDLLEGPLASYRTVLVIPDLLDAPSLWVKPRDINGLLGLEIRCNLCSPGARILKRTFDVCAVVLTLPLWAPLCMVVAAMIWLEDRSTPFFYQNRIGRRRTSFSACKFRTMYPNADVILQQALENDPELKKKWELDFKLPNDPRVTRIGKFLRKFSLDELPQLINVLRGEMSLVGPRPLPAYHHDVLDQRVQTLRERVTPGITGLWQVSGRSDSGSSGMEVYDPYYVRNWSPWLDAVILFRTAGAVLSSAGAY
ncbi:MAG: exopolysaccharide biosynthesis polyprenyl glycosylphosphotransferase [Rhodothermales bacterium]